MQWLTSDGTNYAVEWNAGKAGTIYLTGDYAAGYYISSITMNCQNCESSSPVVTLGTTESSTLTTTAVDVVYTNTDNTVTSVATSATGHVQVNSITVAVKKSTANYSIVFSPAVTTAGTYNEAMYRGSSKYTSIGSSCGNLWSTDYVSWTLSHNDLQWISTDDDATTAEAVWWNYADGHTATIAVADDYISDYYISKITMNCSNYSSSEPTVTIGTTTSSTLTSTAVDVEYTNDDTSVTSVSTSLTASVTVYSVTVELTFSASKYATRIYNTYGSTYYPVSDGSTTQGYTSASAYNTALSALEAAINNSEATDDELIAAAAAMINAAGDFSEDDYVEIPSNFTGKCVAVSSDAISEVSSINSDTWYVLYNSRNGGGYWEDTTPQVAGGTVYMSDGTDVITTTTLASDAAKYMVRFVSTDTDGLYNLQFATGNYVGNSASSGNNVLQTTIQANAVDYRIAAVTSGFNIYESVDGSDNRIVDNNGQGGTVQYWSSDGTSSTMETSDNNTWTIYPVSLTDATDVYSTVWSSYNSTVTTWATTTSEDAVFYPNTTKVAALQALLTSYANPATDEEAATYMAELAEKVAIENVLNYPVDGVAYSLQNKAYTSYYMAEGDSRSLVGITSVATRSLWYFEKNADDYTYAIKNVCTGDYIPAVSDTKNGATASASTANYFNIVYNNVAGQAAFGNDAFYSHLNLSTDGYVILAWGPYAGASNWIIAAVTTDEALATAATAETTLAQSECSSYVDAANGSAISSILGVTVAATDFTSLNDYIDGFDYKVMYKKAEGNYYRFSGYSTGKSGYSISVGTYTDGTVIPVTSTTSTSDVNQLWQIEVGDEGFRIKSPNLEAASQNAYIATPADGTSNHTTFTTQTSAEEFYIDTISSDYFRLRPSGKAATKSINLENTTNYLNAWSGNYSYLNAAKVEAIDITLNQAGDSYYATAYMPFGVTPSGATAYTAGTVADGVMPLTEATSVAAGTAVVLIGSSSSATLTIGDVDGAASSSTLSGKYVDTTVDANSVLTLGAVNSVAGFYTYSGTTLSANKAYLEGSSSAVRFSLGFDNTTDGISAVDSESNTQNDEVYDLSGRRVQKAVKGLYIVNGKKVIK